MDGSPYLRIFASASGLLLCLLGLGGFTVDAEFGEPRLTADLLGFYPVNGWANALHLLAGLIALALAASRPAAWAWLGAVLFTGLGVWGVLAPDGTLLAGALPATRSVNAINLAIGLTGFLALIGSSRIPNPAERIARKRRLRRARRRRAPAARDAGATSSRRPTR